MLDRKHVAQLPIWEQVCHFDLCNSEADVQASATTCMDAYPWMHIRPHCEEVQVSRYGAFSSDNRLESMNKKYKEGLSREMVPISSHSPCLPRRLMHATWQAVGQPSGASLRRGVHRCPSPEKFASPAAEKVRVCENNGACGAD